MTGNVPIGRILIGRGAELNTRNMHKDSALSLAIMSGHAPFVDLLLKSGASKDCDPDGKPLEIFLEWAKKYCACSPANMKKIRALLDPQDELKVKFSSDENR
jgi:ankyrin repeat protein